ncbi:MAG: hypothetical protein AAF567_14370 [Actinomycetota bacterium]
MPEAEPPTEFGLPTDAHRGPIVRPANRSRDAGSGIHDDSTAQAVGFRGGTVAGNIHLDHFPPLLVDRFGPAWFERGVVSMYFREPTMHLEPVQVMVGHGDLARACLVTPQGTLVAEGVAGIGDYPAVGPVRSRDRRATDVAELDLLADLPVDEPIDVGTTSVRLERQHWLLEDRERLPLPLEWYAKESPWGPPIACPSIAVDALWRNFEKTLRPFVKPAVGLYGAIELHHRGAPLLAGVDYELTGQVTDVSQSPRTEIFWAETTAALDGVPQASLVMMIRLLR